MSPAEVLCTVDVAVIEVTRDRRVQLSLTCAAAQAGHVPAATDRRQVVPVRYRYATSGTRRGLVTACDTVVFVQIHRRMRQLKIRHR